MKLVCEREKFLHPFQLAAAVVSVRDVKPVMQNVKIKAAADKVTLMATDSEIGIRVEIPGIEVQQAGEAIIPTRRMKMILQECNDKMLNIEADSSQMIVSTEKSRFQLATFGAEEFPDVIPFEEVSYHRISAGTFRELIRRTVFATDTESTRYALGGVLMEMVGENILGVATDGRRMAFQTICGESVGEHSTENSAIFPPKALQLMERAVTDSDTLNININTNRAILSAGTTVIFTRLIEGRFPRWRNIIPDTQGKRCVIINVASLYPAVRQAAIVISEKQPGVIFRFADGKLTLQAQGAEIGESVVEIPIAYDDSPIEVKFDPGFMSDFLKVLPSETALQLYIQEESPLVCKTEDGFVYVLMPIT
ncbi:MAG: DNA polymerase III subunit beta [Planctomycetaceae bacterium]|jgi:DNA polymerase-3 subunit beta|nr:DNA polymerase III subunit beta [Planctomycetaceae bacterium]